MIILWNVQTIITSLFHAFGYSIFQEEFSLSILLLNRKRLAHWIICCFEHVYEMWKIVDSYQLATLIITWNWELLDVNYLNMVLFPKEGFHRWINFLCWNLEHYNKAPLVYLYLHILKVIMFGVYCFCNIFILQLCVTSSFWSFGGLMNVRSL